MHKLSKFHMRHKNKLHLKQETTVFLPEELPLEKDDLFMIME